MMDSLFSFAFVNAILRKMPAPLAADVERFVQEQGFDTLMLGFLVSPEAHMVLMRALQEALRNVRRFPDRLPHARKALLASVKLGVEVRKCDG